MLKVGLTGGLASGKSFVGHALAGLGCHVIQADAIGHEVLHSGGEAFEPAVREFGREILGSDGEIDRRRLAAVVFDKPERLDLLTRLVHPAVFRREEEWLEEVQRIDPHGIAVVEAAILIETGSYRRYDRIVVAVADREQQIERAIKRDGATREQVLARLERQMPLAEKKKYADYIIDTSGSKEETSRRVGEVYESLRRIAK